METIAPKRTQYSKNRRSPECQRQMVGNGLSEIKQKRDENAGECRRVPEEVGVKWMFKWHMTGGQIGGAPPTNTISIMAEKRCPR